jgi:hypothetical protein
LLELSDTFFKLGQTEGKLSNAERVVAMWSDARWRCRGRIGGGGCCFGGCSGFIGGVGGVLFATVWVMSASLLHHRGPIRKKAALGLKKTRQFRARGWIVGKRRQVLLPHVASL